MATKQKSLAARLEMRTTWAGIWYGILLSGGYVWASSHPAAPYTTFAEALTFGLAIIVTKRVLRKTKWGSYALEFQEGPVDVPDRSK